MVLIPGAPGDCMVPPWYSTEIICRDALWSGCAERPAHDDGVLEGRLQSSSAASGTYYKGSGSHC